MVQWLAHLTCNTGNAGSIPTHGMCVFHSKWISQYFVLARDYVVGLPVLHSNMSQPWRKVLNAVVAELSIHKLKD